MYLLKKISTIILISLLFSCSKKTDPVNKNLGEVIVKFNTSINNLNQGLIHSSNSKSSSDSHSSTTELNQDYIMIATIKPISNIDKIKNPSNIVQKENNRAATTQLGEGIIYKLIVYNADGSYKTFRNYTRGNEEAADPLSLKIGSNYTFIAFSLNSNSRNDLDAVFIDSTVNLSNAKLIIPGNPDLLYFKMPNKTIQESPDNFISIVFDHQFVEVSTIIDVSQTGYSINALTADYQVDKNTATLNLNDNTIVRSSNSFTKNIIFDYFPSSVNNGSISNSIAKSRTSQLLNTGNDERLINITALTIGGIAGTLTPRTIPIPFPTGVTMLPGHKYTLTVEIAPNDRTLTHHDQDAVQINGKIWMRYNLGAPGITNNNSNPDVPGLDIQGNYYQWGKKDAMATGIENTANGNYNGTTITDVNYFNSWNKGTEELPIKGDNDPCPDYFRIPTTAEYNTLLAGINDYLTYEYIGPFNGGNTNYSSALQLISRRNKNAKLTFPAQGFFTYSSNNLTMLNTSGGITSRGQFVYARSSAVPEKRTYTLDNNNIGYGFQYQALQGQKDNQPNIFTGPSDIRPNAIAIGHVLRCVAE